MESKGYLAPTSIITAQADTNNPGLPLSIALPVGAAALSYLNARLSLSQDLTLMRALFGAVIKRSILDKKNKLNVFYALEEKAQSASFRDKDFLVYEDRSYTYKQTYDIVLKYGTWLKRTYNVAPGEVVALDYVNSDHMVFIWLGLWSIGAHPGFINYNLVGKPLLHCIKISTARILLVDPEVQANFTPETMNELTSLDFRQSKGSTGPVEVVFCTPELHAQILNTDAVREPDTAREAHGPAAMAMLVYTSGTTGLPKAGIVTWYKYRALSLFVSHYCGITKNDRIYTPMPLYHSTANMVGFGPAITAGSAFIIGHKFSTSKFWHEVRANNATVIQYVGETCRYLQSAPPTLSETGEDLDRQNNVRLAYGNGLRPDVWEPFKARFGIEAVAEFYASTEGVSMMWNHSANTFASGAIGHHGPIIEALNRGSEAIVKVDFETDMPFRNPNTNFCERVTPGATGELLYKLPPKTEEKFQGYLGNPEATQKKVLRDVFAKGDAWFRTGDVMRRDAEGRTYFSDRIGDTFRWKSENVSTAEVSQVLGLHPSIAEANVYGVSIPHHEGRAGCAALVFKDHEMKPSADRLREIAEQASKNLPRYAIPLFLRVAREMQATGNNKQMKHVLKEEGVEPGRVGEDGIFWFRKGTYVPFGEKEWKELQGGALKL